MTGEGDKVEEENTITQSLTQCRYPKWTIDKVRRQKDQIKEKRHTTKTDKDKNKGLVVEGISENVSGAFKKHVTPQWWNLITLSQNLGSSKKQTEFSTNSYNHSWNSLQKLP